MSKEIPKLEDIAVVCWVSDKNEKPDHNDFKRNVIGEYNGGYFIDTLGVNWHYATLCMSPLEAIEGKYVICDNKEQLIVTKKALVWDDPMDSRLENEYPVLVDGDFARSVIDRVVELSEQIPYSDFVKLPNNPPIEVPEKKVRPMTAEELRGKHIKYRDYESEFLVTTVNPKENLIKIDIATINASDITHYLNDQGEWVYALKEVD